MSNTSNPFQGYDIIVGIDVSASMGQKSVRNPNISRFDEVKELAFGIATQAAQYDDDGIDIITFGQGANIIKGITPDRVAEVFAGGATQYSTDMHELVRVADNRQRETGKNTIVIVFTDGEPSDSKGTEQAIIRAANRIASDENLTFGFVQVGNDPAAARFLASLDDNLTGKGAKFDIVDAITAEQAAVMNVTEMLTKFVND